MLKLLRIGIINNISWYVLRSISFDNFFNAIFDPINIFRIIIKTKPKVEYNRGSVFISSEDTLALILDLKFNNFLPLREALKKTFFLWNFP